MYSCQGGNGGPRVLPSSGRLLARVGEWEVPSPGKKQGAGTPQCKTAEDAMGDRGCEGAFKGNLGNWRISPKSSSALGSLKMPIFSVSKKHGTEMETILIPKRP